MFKNPKYEWMLDYKEPENPFFGGLYWMYMYNKIFSQGTNEDKYELEMSYNRANNVPFPFSIIYNIIDFGGVYQRVVHNFIYEKVIEHYRDESDRDSRARTEANRQHLEELRIARDIKQYGYDTKIADEQALLKEAELDSKHTKEQKEFYYEHEGKKRYLIKFSCNSYLQAKVPILRQETIDVVGDDGENYKVHTIMWDKFHGFYSFAVYSTLNDKNITQVWCTNYGKRYLERKGYSDEFDGIDAKYRYVVEKIVFDTKIGMEHTFDENGCVLSSKSSENRVRTIVKTQKNETVDISKIEKALGIEDAEELNGDIF